MKVAITDQHFGARKSSRVFHDFLKFYDGVLSNTGERGITTVFDLGDTFDNRRQIDLWAAKWAREKYYNRLQEMNVEVHAVVKIIQHTSKIQTASILLTTCLENMKMSIHILRPTEVTIGGLPILFIPWINNENSETTYQLIKYILRLRDGHLGPTDLKLIVDTSWTTVWKQTI